MNKYVKEFLLRGLIFSGLGPIVSGLIYLILELRGVKLALTGVEVFMAIVSTYIMAFVHAGSSIFPQIESFSKIKALFLQMFSIYSVYSLGYILNGWIPFNTIGFIVFTTIFVVTFLLIWLIVYLLTKKTSLEFNKKLEEIKRN